MKTRRASSMVFTRRLLGLSGLWGLALLAALAIVGVFVAIGRVGRVGRLSRLGRLAIVGVGVFAIVVASQICRCARATRLIMDVLRNHHGRAVISSNLSRSRRMFCAHPDLSSGRLKRLITQSETHVVS